MTIKGFYEETAAMYAQYFVEHGEEKATTFVLSTLVGISILNSLYPVFIKDGITPMENIPQEKKEKYWNTACKHYEEMGDRLKASKANYVLELITSTF